MAVMAYRYFAVEFTTGIVRGEITQAVSPASSWQRGLKPGDCSLNVRVLGEDATRQRQLVELTTPGRFSIAVMRGEVCVGEWWLRKRSRAHDGASIALNGRETISYADSRPTRRYSVRGADQFTIARALLAQAFGEPGAPGSVAIDLGSGLSGTQRDRDYFEAEASVGQRLEELAAVLGGFDVWIEPRFESDSEGRRYVVRELRMSSPRAGVDRDWPLSKTLSGEGGNVTAWQLDEDGDVLASEALTIGSGEGPDRIIGRASSGRLIDDGYPSLTRMDSRTSVAQQATADGWAAARLGVSQSATLPPSLDIWADRDPLIGSFGLGDRLPAKAEPSPTMPEGYAGRVRVLGWTLRPPTQGRETVTLSITDADDAPGDDDGA